MKPTKFKRPPSIKDIRADVTWCLYEVLESGRSCNELLPIIFERHHGKDKAWIQEMLYGCLRHLPKLQFWLRLLLTKPLKGKYKILEHLIMLGLYQIVFTRVSSHAAVSETVNASASFDAQSLKGLINAVLRNFERNKIYKTESPAPHVDSGLPKWLFKNIHSCYPDDASKIIREMNLKAPIWLRVNQLETSIAKYRKQLHKQNIEHEYDQGSHAIKLISKVDIQSLPEFQNGHVTVQDKAAQFAATLLGAQSNDSILDCCAAPGGKLIHIMEQNPNIKSLTGIDIDSDRIKKINENINRLVHDQQLKKKIQIQCENATSFQPEKDFAGYDRVLIDAPCSATGVIRRHPDIKWLRKKEDITNLCKLQREILNYIWTLLKPGGTLLYVTCSVLPQENKEQIKSFISRHEDAELKRIIETETVDNPGWQILPGEQGMDGFYYAKLLKAKDKKRTTK